MLIELFFGFCNTESAEVLLTVLMDVLCHFSLDMKSCTLIATDGATNRTGTFCILQAKTREIELRLLYIHCLAHSFISWLKRQCKMKLQAPTLIFKSLHPCF